jgi:hypothetical protein
MFHLEFVNQSIESLKTDNEKLPVHIFTRSSEANDDFDCEKWKFISEDGEHEDGYVIYCDVVANIFINYPTISPV